MFSDSEHVLVERVTLVNSPSFNLQLNQVKHAEVRYINVNTDIQASKVLKAKIRQARGHPTAEAAQLLLKKPYKTQDESLEMMHGLQPEDLNTDGIDPSGTDIWIHDCVVYNDDDSIAVKPSQKGDWAGDCTENVLIENMVLSGFGASIGSVSPSTNHNCVRNVTFRNLSMPRTGKGIYVKSNPHCEKGSTAEITDITYEDINMVQPEWW